MRAPELFDDGRERLEEAVDLLGRAPVPKAESQAAARLVGAQPHGDEDVGRLAGARSTSRAAGGHDAGGVQTQHERLALDAGDGEAGVARQAEPAGAQQAYAGHGAEGAVDPNTVRSVGSADALGAA